MERDCIRPASGSLLGMRYRTTLKQVAVSVGISQEQSLWPEFGARFSFGS